MGGGGGGRRGRHEDNEQPSPRASLASAYSSHSYKLKLVAQRTKYIEHIHIQPAARGAPTSKKFVPGNAAPTSPCCATATQRVYIPRTHNHTRRGENTSPRGCNEMLGRAHSNLSPAVVVFAVPGRHGRVEPAAHCAFTAASACAGVSAAAPVRWWSSARARGGAAATPRARARSQPP